MLLCKGSSDCLCIRHSYCFAVNTKRKGCGCIGDEKRKESCKLGFFCCDWGLIKPRPSSAVVRSNSCAAIVSPASLAARNSFRSRFAHAYAPSFRSIPSAVAAWLLLPALLSTRFWMARSFFVAAQEIDRGPAPGTTITTTVKTTTTYEASLEV
jgi:hypothetical protein